MSLPSVTLLLPNRNNGPVLDLTLRRLLDHTTYPSFELVVVDDGSSDDSKDILRRWRDEAAFGAFTLIEREHGGAIEALNAGLSAASGELIVQLDGDATVETPGWLERMVEFQRSDGAIGVVNSLVTFDSGRIQAAGVNVICAEGLHDRGSWPMEPTGERTLNTRVKRVRPEEAGALVTAPAEVDAAIGVCMLYPRAVAEAIGGYDRGFSPVWFDDVDLSLSARRLGLKVFCLPEVHFVHRMSMRNVRGRTTAVGLMRSRARRALGRVVSQPVKDLIVGAARLNRFGPEQLSRLEHHYRYWREKWGFDLLNPDMDEIQRRYGSTEVCWAYDSDRRRVGEDILRRWTAHTRPDQPLFPSSASSAGE